MTVKAVVPELILAMAAVGAQYCFEMVTAFKLFKVAKLIAIEELRRQEQQHDENSHGQDAQKTHSLSFSGPSVIESWDINELQTGSRPSEETISYHDSKAVLVTAQSVLLLMAMATWGNQKIMFREVLATQGVLVTVLRQEKLLSSKTPSHPSWEEWIHFESAKRTTVMAF